MLLYADGRQAKVGDVVIENGRPERYIVLGFDGHSAKLLRRASPRKRTGL